MFFGQDLTLVCSTNRYWNYRAVPAEIQEILGGLVRSGPGNSRRQKTLIF